MRAFESRSFYFFLSQAASPGKPHGPGQGFYSAGDGGGAPSHLLWLTWGAFFLDRGGMRWGSSSPDLEGSGAECGEREREHAHTPG